MVYNEKLIRLDNKFTSQEDMFTLVLLKAQALMMVLNGIKCFLDGMYLICLDKGEEIKVRKSNVKLQCLYFSPGFINVNLTFDLITSKRYLSLCKKHHYPDFYLFRERNDEFLGIIPLTNAEYDHAVGYFSKIDVHIRRCNTDNL